MGMEYVALLRGINVGGNHRVEMKRLKDLFESLGYSNVSTYLNSGNVLFGTSAKMSTIREAVEARLQKEFRFDIPILIRERREIIKIAEAIPREWRNDLLQKTDVAYLFDEIDSKKILEELPIKKEYLTIKYVKGAILWNLDRKNYNRSHINKLIGHRLYPLMTVRNVNTARFLAGYKKSR